MLLTVVESWTCAGVCELHQVCSTHRRPTQCPWHERRLPHYTRCSSFNREYERKHVAYENNFWATKMNLAGNSPASEVSAKNELDSFLGNKAKIF